MTKIDVVGQAPYPVPISTGRHIAPGEIARGIERTPEVETSLLVGFLREVAPLETPTRKPRAETARDDNQED